MKEVFYFYEDISFRLENELNISEWIIRVIDQENYSLTTLNYIFCSDEFLLNMNKEYLGHDYYTDIIAFNQSDQEGVIEGDVYISIDRVGENARNLGKDFMEELSRVQVHGILHLMGYQDQTDIQKEQMRKKEEACLSLQKFL